MLIECPECKKKISDQAKSCPYCGYPINETKEELKESKIRKSFTVAYRGDPGSIVSIITIIGVFALLFTIGGILLLALVDYLTPLGVFALIFGVWLDVTTIVYISYFVHNKQNMSHNCIEYDAEKDKLVLCTLYGEIIEIDVEDYLELKDNFFTDNMLLFTYKTKENKTKKVKLGYCSNRDEIRNNIRKIRE